MLKVTFDSNVWRKVASPDKFPNDPEIEIYKKIREACISKRVCGFISETTFTLEQIKKEERLDFFLDRPKATATTDCSQNVVKISLSIGPSNNTMPMSINMVKDHLNDSFDLGLRILRSGRIATPNSPMLSDRKYFVKYRDDDEFHHYNNKNGEISRKLESMGFGIKLLKDIGSKHAERENKNHWFDGFTNLSDDEKQRIPSLVAEWADVDSVSTSIAHDISFFCTNDLAKGASKESINSIMSNTNSTHVSKLFGIQFVTPRELLNNITKGVKHV